VNEFCVLNLSFLHFSCVHKRIDCDLVFKIYQLMLYYN